MFELFKDLLFKIQGYLPHILGMMLIIGIIAIGIIIYLVRRARKGAQATEKTEPERQVDDADVFGDEVDDLPLLPLKKSFKYAINLLRTHVRGRNFRYSLPWYLMIGPKSAGKSTALEYTGLNLPVGRPEDEWEGAPADCKWWFFDRGVVLDVDGDYVQRGTGRTSNVRGWRRLLQLLVDYRPRRPIDGVVLTIPISELLDAKGAPLRQDHLERRAESLYRKLWEAQHRLGLAFPVYVLLTKCDALPGFQTLVKQLSPELRTNMLGWSSPYAFENQFTEKWVDQALAETENSIRTAQFELLASSGETDTNEQIFFLYSHIEKLREPLRTFLRHIFKPSAYHEAFGLRGIYFSGDGGVEHPGTVHPSAVFSGVFSGPKESANRPVFLHDLFESKIFPEQGLARPARRALLSRNRAAMTAQIATAALIVLGGLGLWRADVAIDDGMQTLTPFVTTLGEDMAEAKTLLKRREQGTVNQETVSLFKQESTVRLLESMTRVNIDNLFSIFMPSSWFSDLDDDLVRYSATAFSKIIVNSMRDGLILKANNLVATPLQIPPEDTNDIRSLRGPEFRKLVAFLSDLGALETNIRFYNELGREGRVDLVHVRNLVRYIYGIDLPEGFLSNTGFYEEALRDISFPALDPTTVSADLRARFRRQEIKTIKSLFADNQVVRKLRKFGREIDAAVIVGASARNLSAIQEDIKKARRALHDNRYPWLSADKLDPKLEFPKITANIGRIKILGLSDAENFLKSARQSFERMKGILKRLRSVELGPLLVSRDDKAVPELNPPVVRLERVLKSLFERAFMVDRRTIPLPSRSGSTVSVSWNAEFLDQGLSLSRDFDLFTKEELARVTPKMRTLIKNVALRQFERQINDRIARSRQIVRGGRLRFGQNQEDSLRLEIASLAKALPSLTQIMATFDGLGLEDSFIQLGELVGSESVDLLRLTDSLFVAEDHYLPRGNTFGWWNGSAPVNMQAFNVADDVELREYLAQQRNRIELVATEYANPALAFLGNNQLPLSSADNRLVFKWRRIIEELAKFNQKKANNSLTALEEFIVKDMGEIDTMNCALKIKQSHLTQRSGDYFLERRNDLRRKLFSRCKIDAIGAYDRVAQAFNRDLAGKFPFTKGPYTNGEQEVDPNDIRSFFVLYDRQGPLAKSAVEASALSGDDRERALVFMSKMEQVRNFFGPYLALPVGQAKLTFDVDVGLRVNRARELGGNQIIDWQTTLGPRSITLLDKEKRTRWAFGEPVSIRLRWANNSPSVPALDINNPTLGVRNQSATLQFTNRWSLLDLIRRQASGPEDFVQLVDPKPQTLRFLYPTRPTGGGPIVLARVYLRYALSGLVDKKRVGLIAPEFPDSAPLLINRQTRR
jgi:type VI secretion system protein ImpL